MAGLPAVARAVREVALAGFGAATVTVPGPWLDDPVVTAEVARLAAGMPVAFATESEALQAAGTDSLLVSGERLLDAELLRLARSGARVDGTGTSGEESALRDGGGQAALTEAGKRIIRETAKPGDGIVSRHLNRPVSQAISRLLLHFDSIRPVHGSWGTALIAVVMFACLLTGTDGGLMAGAALFQFASIFDGVDGEIARATFRTSPEGARLDSLIDAVTNVACLGGVALNLYMQGETMAALAGVTGIVLLATGLTVIGRRARAHAAGLNFNAVKEHFSGQRSRLMTWLTWLTMRDFFALFGAVLVIAGFAVHAMFAFAVIAAGWLVVVLSVMHRQPA